MTQEDREAIERANQIAREIWERDWLEAGGTLEELEQSLYMAKWFQEKTNQGYDIDDVRQQWDEEERKKKKSKEKVPVSS